MNSTTDARAAINAGARQMCANTGAGVRFHCTFIFTTGI